MYKLLIENTQIRILKKKKIQEALIMSVFLTLIINQFILLFNLVTHNWFYQT